MSPSVARAQHRIERYVERGFGPGLALLLSPLAFLVAPTLARIPLTLGGFLVGRFLAAAAALAVLVMIVLLSGRWFAWRWALGKPGLPPDVVAVGFVARARQVRGWLLVVPAVLLLAAMTWSAVVIGWDLDACRAGVDEDCQATGILTWGLLVPGLTLASVGLPGLVRGTKAYELACVAAGTRPARPRSPPL